LLAGWCDERSRTATDSPPGSSSILPTTVGAVQSRNEGQCLDQCLWELCKEEFVEDIYVGMLVRGPSSCLSCGLRAFEEAGRSSSVKGNSNEC
jgi:hypothetical protein